MQKILKLVIAGIIGITASRAHAIDNVYRPYLVANYAYTTNHFDGGNSYYNAPYIVLGSTYNPYFSTELFYQISDKHKDNGVGLQSSHYQAYGLDMLAYLPLFTDKINLIGTAGIGEYTMQYNPVLGSKSTDHGWGYRFGGGVGFNLDQSWSLRFLTRHIELDKLDNQNHMLEYSVGLKYIFNY